MSNRSVIHENSLVLIHQPYIHVNVAVPYLPNATLLAEETEHLSKRRHEADSDQFLGSLRTLAGMK
jgi:hypothetical protein